MAVVGDVSEKLTELRPGTTAKRTQILDLIVVARLLVQPRSLSLQILINKALDVVLISRPDTLLFVPNRIEGSTLDHQIFRSTDFEIWIQLQSFLCLFYSDLIEVHNPPLICRNFQQSKRASDTRVLL